jgi:D-xylose transport system substrate-binding protein
MRSMNFSLRTTFAFLLAFTLILSLAACQAATTDTTAAPTIAPTPTPDGPGKIALFLPENGAPRYEKFDYPFFVQRLEELGLNVDEEFLYYNAENNVRTQTAQVEEALASGAKVLVLGPVSSEQAAELAIRGKEAGATIIAYDRNIVLTDQVDYHVNFDVIGVGVLQGQSLVRALSNVEEPNVVLIHGSPLDANALFFKRGLESALEGTDINVLAEYDNIDWSAATAETHMTRALQLFGEEIDGVYAANDGTAEGAITAMKASGLETIPPTTGQDADLAAIQRIVAGEQYSTIYKAIPIEAEAAAELAYAILRNETIPLGLVNGTVFNGEIDVPAVLLEPTLVTLDNIADTVIADGFWTLEDICVREYIEPCREAGLFDQ